MSKAHSSATETIVIGTLPITGLPETGERVSISFLDDQVATAVGTGGETAYAVTRTRRAQITITIMKSSKVNQALLLAHRAALLAGTLLGPFYYSDGRTKYSASTGMFVKVPDFSATDGADQTVQWVMECANLIGGPRGLDDAETINVADYVE
jgi:hypothetical protein